MLDFFSLLQFCRNSYGKLLVFLSFCFCNTLFAQNNVTSLWKDVEKQLESGVEWQVKGACERLIVETPIFDEYAQKARFVLAKLALEKASMNSIYEGCAYFDSLIQKQGQVPDSYNSLRAELHAAYDSLLIEDIQKSITSGVYFSDYCDENNIPLVILEIKENQNGYSVSLSDGGQLGQSLLEDSGCYIYSSEVMQYDDQSYYTYNSYWGGSKSRNPNTGMAHSFVNSSQDFKRNMYGEMASGYYKTSDVVAGTVATEVIGGLFSLLGGALAKGKVVGTSFSLDWYSIGDGKLSACLTINREIVKTGGEPKNDTQTFKFTLFKLYPHHRIFFYNPDKKLLLDADGFVGEPTYKNRNYRLFECFHPAFLDEYLSGRMVKEKPDKKIRYKWKKMRQINALMYKYWAYHSLFASLQDDPMLGYAPSLDQMQCVYFNNGSVCLGKYIEKTKYFERFMAYRDSKGDIVYTECNGNGNPVKRKQSIYYADGGYFHGEMFGNKQTGVCSIVYLTGDTYQGEAINFKREGIGKTRWIDGSEFQGICKDDKAYDGIYTFRGKDFVYERRITGGISDSLVTITYQNGDLYRGESKMDFIPNGKGVMTKATGTIQKGDWKDGKLVIVPKKKSRKKRR